MGERKSWTEIATPLVNRCEVAAALQAQAVWNPKGADALGKILKRMAEIIDTEIDYRTPPPQEPTP